MDRDLSSLLDILNASKLILGFIQSKSFRDFETDMMLNSAVEGSTNGTN